MKPANFAPVYCALYPELAQIARKHGYALAIHGSMARDFDLICIPWAEKTSPPQIVVDDMTATFAMNAVTNPSLKQHGRLAYNISFGFGEFFADLSFIPVGSSFNDGVTAAANWVDQQRQSYDSEHGSTDNDTGTFEFGNDAQRDYSATLEEIADGIRALHPNTAPPAPVVPEEITSASAPEVFEIAAEAERLGLRGTYASYAVGWNACRAAMLQGSQPVSNRDELPLDYLQGHKDGLEWAAQLAEANHPQTGDWLYDDPTELAKAIRKGPDMPPVESGNPPVVPDGWIKCSERMPTKQDGTVFLTWNGQYIGKELFLMGSFQCLKPEIITHWMPLPAAPQQDEK